MSQTRILLARARSHLTAIPGELVLGQLDLYITRELAGRQVNECPGEDKDRMLRLKGVHHGKCQQKLQNKELTPPSIRGNKSESETLTDPRGNCSCY